MYLLHKIPIYSMVCFTKVYGLKPAIGFRFFPLGTEPQKRMFQEKSIRSIDAPSTSSHGVDWF